MREPSIFWVNASFPGRVAVVGRPRRTSHFKALKAAGIDVLVSLLEREEAKCAGLDDEADHCARVGIEFMSLPVTDHGIPNTFAKVEYAVTALSYHLGAGRGVGAHCFAGLGRSPLLVAALLIAHGRSNDEAVALVSAARGHRVPEMGEQHDWLFDFARRPRS